MALIKQDGREARAPTQHMLNARYFHTSLKSMAGYIAICGIGLFFFLPWVWLVSASLKAPADIFDQAWIPRSVEWNNYVRAVTYIPYLRYLQNTLVICGLVVVGRVVSCSMVAYGFSHVRWPWRDGIFALVLATMMLPFQVTMIPLYVIFQRLGWIGTILPLTVPAFFGDAFFIFLLRQFFLSIPVELREAAVIDGATHRAVFVRIVLPLAKPALATIVLFSFLWTYTDFQAPLLYLPHPETWTLSLGLRGYLGAHGGEWSLLMAASVLFSLPVILLFFLAQRTFIEGISTTGLR